MTTTTIIIIAVIRVTIFTLRRFMKDVSYHEYTSAI